MTAASRYLYCDTLPPFAPGSSPFHIKGEFYRNVATSVHDIDTRFKGALRAKLTNEGLLPFMEQQFLSSSMYDVLPMPRVMMAIASVMQRDLRELTSKLAHSGAEFQMTGVYKTLIEPMTIENFAKRFGHLVERSYDFGPMTITASAQNATVVREGIPACIAEWWSLVSVPYALVPLEHNGAQHVHLEPTITLAGASITGLPLARVEWRIQWQQLVLPAS